MKNYINFKEDVEVKELQNIDPRLLIILADASYWAYSRGLDFTITRMIDTMIAGISKTDIHHDARAADARSKTWPEFQKNALLEHINSKYAEKWGTGPLCKCAIWHVGTEEHFHFQVRG